AHRSPISWPVCARTLESSWSPTRTTTKSCAKPEAAMLSVYPDTSFLFSLYLPRPSSESAAKTFAELDRALPVTKLLLYELENALRLAAWMNTKDKRQGIPMQMAQVALARLDGDLESGVLEVIPCDLAAVIDAARQLSNTRTWRGGHRSFDLMHIATARHL